MLHVSLLDGSILGKSPTPQARRPAQLPPLSACARTSGPRPAPRFARLARVGTRTANREYCCGGRGRLDGIVCARAEARAAAGNHTNLIAATLCAPPLCTPHAFHRTFRDSGTPQACRSCARFLRTHALLTLTPVRRRRLTISQSKSRKRPTCARKDSTH